MIIKNRAGRIVEVSEELGRHMIKNDGAILYEPEMNKGIPQETEQIEEGNSLKCPYCDKECANQLGFNKHVEACKKKATLSQSLSPQESENPSSQV